jgi:hypothetical protein
MVRSSRWLLVLLLVVVAACSKKKSSESQATGSAGTGTAAVAPTTGPATGLVSQWNVVVTEAGCSANIHGDCPPNEPCDPPPPRAIECPAGVPEGNVVVGQREDGACVIANTNQPTPCPLPAGQALPPRRWAVTAQPDGTCRASWSSPATGAHAVTIRCPVPDANVVIERRGNDGPCSVAHGGKTLEVPCPAEPKSMTAADLRAAKDLPADQRVRVQGFHVASVDASVGGKATTFILGAADAKADAKQAIRCTSKLAFIEIPDAAPVIVEGFPKRTPDGVQLTECQAWVP